jgi:hypothetical protein
VFAKKRFLRALIEECRVPEPPKFHFQRRGLDRLLMNYNFIKYLNTFRKSWFEWVRFGSIRFGSVPLEPVGYISEKYINTTF